jgi:hypothetical protein
MEEHIQTRIKKAKELLATTRNASMATVNIDGTPHNTPFFFIRDNKLKYVYWGSHPESLHSRNAERTGNVFIVLYESNAGSGLYIKAEHAKQLSGMELENALVIHNTMREREGKKPIPLSYYSSKSPQRMYSAQPTNFYVNVAARDSNGYVIKEYRHEISAEELAGI